MVPSKHTRENGFTLIEILVVIGIIGLLAAIAVPIFLNQRKSSQEASLKSDLKNLGVAFETELVQNDGKYPDTIPADFKKSEDNVFAIVAESGNTNVSSGSQKNSTELYPGVIGHYSSVYYPTRTTVDGVVYTTYSSTETQPTTGGHYWQYRPSEVIPQGDPFTGSVTVRSSKDVCMRLGFEMFKSTPGRQVVYGPNTCLVANQWTKLEVSGLTPYETTVITMIAYSSHDPGSTFDYKEQIIVLGTEINEEQMNVAVNQRFCVQGYNLNDTKNIWNYSALNGGVRKGRC